jgi:hypothetical protein
MFSCFQGSQKVAFRSVDRNACERERGVPEIIDHSGRIASSGMLRRVALVRTDVSEELSASFITVTRIGELGTRPALTNDRRTQRVCVCACVRHDLDLAFWLRL